MADIRERKARLKHLKDTTANWERANPILLDGEMGIEDKGNGKLATKMGDGITPWKNLPYYAKPVAEVEAEMAASNQALQNQIDNIVLSQTNSGDVTAEVVQARVSAKGTNYPTLKARLDDMEEKSVSAENNFVLLAESVEWLSENGDTNNKYLLPDWHLYEYTTKENVTIKRTVKDNITLTDGIRIGSDGTDRTQVGYCATPHIDLTNIPKPCTIHLTNAKWVFNTSSETGYVMYYATKADGTKLVGGYTNDTVGNGYFTVTKNGGSITDVTVTVFSDEVATIRFSGCWTGHSESTTSFANANTKAVLQYEVEELYETYTGWFDTGHLIISENTIIKIESDIKDVEAEVDELKTETESTVKVAESLEWLATNGDTSRVYITKKGAVCIYNVDKWEEYVPAQSSATITEEDKNAIVADILEILGYTTYCTISDDNVITINGDIPDDAYTLKYEMEDESTLDVSSFDTTNTSVTYTITANFANCVSDNNATQINSGESYSATITANSDYIISTITVVMGGEDVTSSVVSGKTINIESVTGDIVITAVVNKVVYLDPVTVDIGLRDGIRLGSDGGDRTGATGYCATERIDLTDIPKPCTINLTKAKWAYDTSSETGYIMTCARKADSTNLVAAYTNDTIGSGYFTVTNNGGSVTVTVTSDEVAEICFSGQWANKSYSDSDVSFASANTKATLTYTPFELA